MSNDGYMMASKTKDRYVLYTWRTRRVHGDWQAQNAAALRFAWHRRQEVEESMLVSARFSAIVLIACSQSALSTEIN